MDINLKRSTLLIIILLSLIACGKSSTSAGGGKNEIALSLSGSAFNGTFTNNTGTDSGQISINLTQTEDDLLSGVISITDSICLESGPTNGALNGNSGNLVVQQSFGTLTLAISATNDSIEGTYTVSFAGEEGCSNSTGTGSFSASR